MTLLVELTPELDARLREEAARLGVEPGQYVAAALKSHLEDRAAPDCAEATEAQLLEEVNRGLTESEWRRYRQVVEQRRSEQISADELDELARYSDRLEELNARRMQCLAELAQRRGESLEGVMDQLGISTPAVI